MFICIPKINFVIPFFLEILQFKETCSLIGRHHFFCPITQEPEFCQIWGWWWNTNKNISLHSRLFPGKTSGKIFQKIPQNSILGPFWALFAQIWAKIIYHRGKNQKKTNDPFLIKIPKWQTDGNTDRQIERQTNRQTDRHKGNFIGPPVGRGPNILESLSMFQSHKRVNGKKKTIVAILMILFLNHGVKTVFPPRSSMLID